MRELERHSIFIVDLATSGWDESTGLDARHNANFWANDHHFQSDEKYE
jgi:hypothetical protein